MTAPQRLRVGVVGLGIGQAHLLAYVLDPNRFEVVAVADTDASRREQAATDWGVATVATLDELLDLELDVVDLCTPPALHTEQILASLATGRHVICEKPLVGTLDELAVIEDAAANSTGDLMPIFQYRFAPGMARMKAVADSGLCGKLYLATSETTWLRGEEYYSAPWRGTVAGEAGGAVFGHGTHAHDLLSQITGPLTSIQGRVATLVNDIENEDCAVGIGAVADGGLVSMSVTLGSLREITRLRFCFANVTVESATDPYEPGREPWAFDWATEDLAEQAAEIWRSLPETPSGFGGQLAAFHRSIATGSPLPVTLADARRALELVDGWYRSAETGTAVELSGE